jgi:hypothetical protein
VPAAPATFSRTVVPLFEVPASFAAKSVQESRID